MAERQIILGVRFERDFKSLRRKHPKLEDAVNDLLAAIAAADETPPGDRLIGVDEQPVFKTRIALDKGKSGGARIIYFCSDNLVVPLYIYGKGDLANVSSQAVVDALKECGLMPSDEAAKSG